MYFVCCKYFMLSFIIFMQRLSEFCCFALSHLLMLGKSVICSANKSKSEEDEDDSIKVDWPEDSVSKAQIIRSKAQLMSVDVESISNSFLTGMFPCSGHISIWCFLFIPLCIAFYFGMQFRLQFACCQFSLMKVRLPID